MHVKTKLRSARACLLALACVLPAGCASMAGLQDWQFSSQMKGRAADALKSSFTPEQRKSHSSDFQCGFKKGYYEVAMNRDCRLPPTAPPKYWSAYYQTCEGQKRIEDWFAGYQQGIAVAQSTGQSGSAEVTVSPGAPVLNKTGCGSCYSANPCNCPPDFTEAPSVYPIESYPIGPHPQIENSPSDHRHRTPRQIEAVEPAEITRALRSGDTRPLLLPVSHGPTGLIGGYDN